MLIRFHTHNPNILEDIKGYSNHFVWTVHANGTLRLDLPFFNFTNSHRKNCINLIKKHSNTIVFKNSLFDRLLLIVIH